MRRIAVSLSKGGVGKTTTAVNLAAGLAIIGKRVLMVDTDTQGQVSSILGIQPEVGLTELLRGDATLEEAITEARERLWLLAGGSGLAGLKRLIAQEEFGGERMLSEALEPLEGQYDYVILDGAPGWDALTVNVLFYAREILAPVSLEVMTLQGLVQFTQRLKAIQRYHQELELKYVLPTFYDRRVKKSDEILRQLKLYYEQQICCPIRYNVRLSEAPGYGQHIFEYDAKCPGAEDYAKLIERVSKNGSK